MNTNQYNMRSIIDRQLTKNYKYHHSQSIINRQAKDIEHKLDQKIKNTHLMKGRVIMTIVFSHKVGCTKSKAFKFFFNLENIDWNYILLPVMVLTKN